MIDKSLKVLKGVNGQMELYSDRIIITRKGLVSKMTQGFFKGAKTIFINQITSIQVKEGGWLTNGYIQFSFAGGNENIRGISDATKDENTVMFKRGSNKLVREIKQYVEKNVSRSNNNSSTISIAEEIKQLKSLLEQGVISKKEFELKKNQLLS